MPELWQFLPLCPFSGAGGPELCLVFLQAQVSADRLWGFKNYVLGYTSIDRSLLVTVCEHGS